jgi:hypothetical protein
MSSSQNIIVCNGLCVRWTVQHRGDTCVRACTQYTQPYLEANICHSDAEFPSCAQEMRLNSELISADLQEQCWKQCLGNRSDVPQRSATVVLNGDRSASLMTFIIHGLLTMLYQIHRLYNID